ncbi:DUF72 domain-containing protein [Thermodesulfobacteriota bacterium]
MGKILIGTSGYYYDDWKGPFYPNDMAKKDYLEYYSRHFQALELNYTYYRLPEEKQSEAMIARAGTDMTFVVKAHREMTHKITENSISTVLPRFLNGIGPFIDNHCLGSILLQFPQSFHYTDKNRIYLKRLIQELLPVPLSVEFRNKDWLKESVYSTLSELHTGFVCVDEPELPGLIPKLDIITSETGYIRFHGRNRNNWYGTDSMSRYDYLYSKEELEEWLPLIKEIKDQTEKLFIFFNNHAKSQAVTNARMLINLFK